MLQQIEKLQKKVNGLLKLCAGGGADVEPDRSLTAEEKKLLRLGVMILQMQDGELEPRYAWRLGKWLEADNDALCYYVDFQSLTGMLYMHLNPHRFSQYWISERLLTGS